MAAAVTEVQRRPGPEGPRRWIANIADAGSRIVLEDETESSRAPMCGRADAPRLMDMKKRLLFLLLVTGLIVLALGGWTVQGLRWAATGGWLRGLPQPA